MPAKHTVIEENGYRYIEEGSGDPIVLLHGLFGALSNWDSVVKKFSGNFRVIIPMLPIYEMPIRKAGIPGLTAFVEGFMEMKKLQNVIMIGNSLGGHIGLMYTLSHQENVKKLVLTGSSGLFENGMGGSYPRRGSYEFIKEKVEYTFYDPKTATEEYIQEVFDTINNIQMCMRIVAIAKSAQRTNMADELSNIKTSTLLIWGLNDTITPPMVAHDFNRLLTNSELRFIDKCCHAPMMECPDEFNDILEEFLFPQ